MVRLFSFMMITSAIASVLDCAPTTSLFKLLSMTFSPDPAIKGQNSTLILSMTVPEQIDAGRASYAFTYNFIPFAPIIENLCNSVVCPILPGTLMTRSSYPIDSYLSGTIQIKISWKDNSSRDLMCVNVRTTIGSSSRQIVQYSTKPLLPLPMCPLYKNMTYKSLVKFYKVKNVTKTRLRRRV